MKVCVERLALPVLGVAALLAGCASPREAATFVTKTSFGLVDIDSTPATVSIAFDRVEGYLGPRYGDGNIFPVASSIESKGRGIDREIRQVYATGNAARIVTRQVDTNAGMPPAGRPARAAAGSTGTTGNPPVGKAADERKVVFFGTGTTVGLKIGFVEGTPVPNSFTLGYKRKEVSVIPVDPGREPSVLGTFDNTVGVEAAPGAAQATAAFGIEQYFATGEAADNLAGLGAVQTRFRRKAERAMGDVEKYRAEEARQGRLALETLKCFSELADDRLDRVWNNADDLGIFDGWNTVPRIRAATGALKKRQIYIADIGLLNADDAQYTQALDFHRKVVCKLRTAAG